MNGVTDVYKCVRVEDVVDRESNFSGRIYLPQSLLSIILATYGDELPVLHFSIESDKNGKKTHCSVKEFTAAEGMAYLPSWIMSQLEVKEEDEVTVTLVPNLVDGIKATFKINQQEQFLPNDPLKALEEKLRHYSCLSLNDALEIELEGTVFTVTVTELEPTEVVSIINIDLNIDIEWEEEKQLELPPGEHMKPDYDWQIGSIHFPRYEKRPERPRRESGTLFPGQGKRLENFDGPLEIDRQPETEDETSKTNNSSDDSAWD